jgi:hypothetical protein
MNDKFWMAFAIGFTVISNICWCVILYNQDRRIFRIIRQLYREEERNIERQIRTAEGLIEIKQLLEDAVNDLK